MVLYKNKKEEIKYTTKEFTFLTLPTQKKLIKSTGLKTSVLILKL